MAPPAPASALHRHQSSLEGILDFSSQPPLDPAYRTRAEHRFNQIINHFESEGIRPGCDKYDGVKLVSLTYDHSTGEKSKDRLLAAFFTFAGLSIAADEDIDFTDRTRRDELRASLDNFADYLFDNFFLPLKASTKKTPQPSPASHSAVMRTQRQGHIFAGTPERIANLRGACLIRDRYRCVVSRKFDQAEALERFGLQRRGQGEACDQDGQPLAGQRFEPLEVARILPHSLTQLDSRGELFFENASKEAALAILDMLDDGAAHLIEGVEIDRPRNALTLTQNLHTYFGDFRIFFKPEGTVPHKYHIGTFLPQGFTYDVPVTRTLFLTRERNIDPPSSRLLAIHCAIAHILYLSAAGDYIDDILRDADKQ
ncbi:hypothetical protein F66182_4224 [Fusarium sp. NRRL 66182]|nr:hypothetical protein F66182_4224 [Fusarium sp. NRRL 66182]